MKKTIVVPHQDRPLKPGGIYPLAWLPKFTTVEVMVIDPCGNVILALDMPDDGEDVKICE